METISRSIAYFPAQFAVADSVGRRRGGTGLPRHAQRSGQPPACGLGGGAGGGDAAARWPACARARTAPSPQFSASLASQAAPCEFRRHWKPSGRCATPAPVPLPEPSLSPRPRRQCCWAAIFFSSSSASPGWRWASLHTLQIRRSARDTPTFRTVLERVRNRCRRPRRGRRGASLFRGRCPGR